MVQCTCNVHCQFHFDSRLAKVPTVDICVSVVANGFQWQGRQQQLDEKFMDFCVSPLDLHDGAKQTGKDSGRRRVCVVHKQEQPIPQEVQATPSANASSSAGPIGPPLVPTARQQHEQKDIKGSSGVLTVSAIPANLDDVDERKLSTRNGGISGRTNRGLKMISRTCQVHGK